MHGGDAENRQRELGIETIAKTFCIFAVLSLQELSTRNDISFLKNPTQNRRRPIPLDPIKNIFGQSLRSHEKTPLRGWAGTGHEYIGFQFLGLHPN